MRHPILISAALLGAMTLSACDQSGDAQVERALQDVNVVDETNLNDVMLTVADPNEAVNYFLRASTNDPGRIDLMRGLAKSLIRARRPSEAATAWQAVVDHEDSNLNDKIDLADAMIRTNDWDGAEEVLDTIPPTHETYKRYRLEAMVADSNEEWASADSFYETAA